MLDGIQLGAVKERKCKDFAKDTRIIKNKEPSEKQNNTSDLFFNCDDKIIYANAEKKGICNKIFFSEYREAQGNIFKTYKHNKMLYHFFIIYEDINI